MVLACRRRKFGYLSLLKRNLLWISKDFLRNPENLSKKIGWTFFSSNLRFFEKLLGFYLKKTLIWEHRTQRNRCSLSRPEAKNKRVTLPDRPRKSRRSVSDVSIWFDGVWRSKHSKIVFEIFIKSLFWSESWDFSRKTPNFIQSGIREFLGEITDQVVNTPIF